LIVRCEVDFLKACAQLLVIELPAEPPAVIDFFV